MNVLEFKLTAIERKKLKEIATYLENSRYRPYKNVSGGFVQSSILGVTERTISIELKYGVQNDTEDAVFTEHHHFNRGTITEIPYEI